MTRLDAAEFERATTWNLTIAAELFGKDAPYRDEGKERKWGSFHLCRQTGAWHDWATGSGGYSSIQLIKHLRPDYSVEDAVQWLKKFLGQREGTGRLEAEDDELTQTHQAATAGLARHFLETAPPLPPDSHGAAYLASRGFPGPYPEALRWVANARPGEGALVIPLTAHDRTTGVLLTYVDARGKKSLVAPVRRRLDLERAPDAVMVIQEPTLGVVDISATMVVAEGLENSLSLAHPEVAHAGWKIIGLPGISTLKNVPAKAGDRIIIVQDSDPPDHPAQLGLQAGIDSLILQGAQVRRTDPSEDGDANKILQTKGPAALKRLLGRPVGAPLKFKAEKLSINGEIVRLAKLSPTDYERERKKVAKDSEWRVTALDKAVARIRPAPAPADDGSPAGGLSVPEDPPYTEAIPPLVTLLEEIRKQIGRFVAITEEQLTAVTLWIAAAHLVHSAKLDLQLFPKLALQSKDPASGKTTLLSLIWNCLPRAKLWTLPTGAYLVRALEQAAFSLCLDELQYAEDRNLLRVINASQHKPLAYVPLLVPDHKGAYIPHEFFVWAPMALARLGEFSAAQQSRSIIIWMMPKLAGEKRDHLRRPVVPELALCRRQLAAWGDSLEEWTDPEIPSVLRNRDIDNWTPLLFTAEQAGGRWPKLVAEAVVELMKTERQPTINVRLLRSIWMAYQPTPDAVAPDFLATSELLARLVGDQDEEWATMGPAGRSITPQWLRERLSNQLDPPGSTREHAFGPRGYAFRQFEKAFERHLGGHPAEDSTILTTPSDPSGSSGTPGEKAKKASKIKGSEEPDAKSHTARAKKHPARSDSADAEPDVLPDEPPLRRHQARENPKDSAKNGDAIPVEPDEPDKAEGVGEDIHSPDERGWENLDPEPPKKTRPTARSRRAKPNGGDPDPAVESRASLVLDLPEPSLLDYIEGSIANEIRQLHAANPKRSLKWIAKQSGQPSSLVREILGDGEVAP